MSSKVACAGGETLSPWIAGWRSSPAPGGGLACRAWGRCVGAWPVRCSWAFWSPPSLSCRPVAAEPPAHRPAASHLPLGPAGLPETRTDSVLQPGVTVTTIVRGNADPDNFWTVEVNIPAGSTSPDPDAPPAALSDRMSAEALAGRLRTAGFSPRVEEVTAPATADYLPGTLGWRVRVGRAATQAETDAALAQVVAAGFAGASRFTGWDGAPSDHGPWNLQVLTIDPRAFAGRLFASYGPDIEDRETTSALSRSVGATAGVNAGYFVLDPAAGAPGDPAGVGVYRGRLLSETVNSRPALVLRDDARRTQIERLRWLGTLQARAGRLRLDGLDRVPGLIRNCGGLDDMPTTRPLHDFTCTDDGELVVFTPQFGQNTPAGPGIEAVLDRRSRVVSLRSPRGGPLLPGYRSVQATGDRVTELRSLAKLGVRMTVTTRLLDRGDRTANHRRDLDRQWRPGAGSRWKAARHPPGRRVRPPDRSQLLLRLQRQAESSNLRWRRRPRPYHPRHSGRPVDRQPRPKHHRDRCGRRGAGNGGRDEPRRWWLDDDGDDGQVVNQPSDATGERPIGDALLVLPSK